MGEPTAEDVKREIRQTTEHFHRLARNESLSGATRNLAADLRNRARKLGPALEDALVAVPRSPKPKRSALLSGEALGGILVRVLYIFGFFVVSGIVLTFVRMPFLMFGNGDFPVYVWLVIFLGVVGFAIVTWVQEVNEKAQEEEGRFDGEERHLASERQSVVTRTFQRLSTVTKTYEDWITEQQKMAGAMSKASTDATAQVKSAVASVGNAKSYLDSADRELKAGAFIRFWEMIEGSVGALAAAAAMLERAKSAGKEYDAKLVRYEGSDDVPVFGISSSTFEEIVDAARETNLKLQALSYEAQKNPHFAQIYEMRRNTATLVEGFQSMREAIDGLAARIEGAIMRLDDTVSRGFDATVSSLDNIHRAVEELTTAQEQNNEILARAAGEIEGLRAEANRSYAELREHARFSKASFVEALRNDHDIKTMLRGIETGKPSPGQRFGSKEQYDLYGTIFDSGPNIPR